MSSAAYRANDSIASNERGSLHHSFVVTNDEYRSAAALLNNVGAVLHRNGDGVAAMKSYREALQMRLVSELDERCPERNEKCNEDCIFKAHEARLFLLQNRKNNAATPPKLPEIVPAEGDGSQLCSDLIGMQYYATPLWIDGSDPPAHKDANELILFNISMFHLQCDNIDSAIQFLALIIDFVKDKDERSISSSQASILELMAMTNLGFALYRQRRFEESSQCIEDAIFIAQKSLDAASTTTNPDHQAAQQRLAAAYVNLSRSYHASGLLDEAMAACTKAENLSRAVSQASFGEKASVASSLPYVKALIYQCKGEHDQAIQTYQLFAEQSCIQGCGHTLHVATALRGIGQILFQGNHLQEATKALVQSLTIQTGVLGEQHYDVAETLYEIGRVLHDREEFADALDTYQRALSVQRQLSGGIDNLKILKTLCNISRVRHIRGELPEALTSCQDVLMIARAELGHQHLFVAEVLLTEAQILSELGQRNCAVSVCSEAARIMESLKVEKAQAIIEECSNCVYLGRTPDAAAA